MLYLGILAIVEAVVIVGLVVMKTPATVAINNLREQTEKAVCVKNEEILELKGVLTSAHTMVTNFASHAESHTSKAACYVADYIAAEWRKVNEKFHGRAILSPVSVAQPNYPPISQPTKDKLQASMPFPPFPPNVK